MRALFVYLVSGIAFLVIFGYSIHMFIGGLVSPRTEWIAIGVAEAFALVVIGAMIWDVLRRQR
ncbi:MAG: hypothetical protein D6771_00045 [Zetaproteobacteria bacterium]|nr:MAG: hypothetical protein D6771_00045 [Zetaproteobacteria bacterium]